MRGHGIEDLPLKESVGHLDVLSLDYCEHQVLESRCGVISVEVEGGEVTFPGAPPVPMSEGTKTLQPLGHNGGEPLLPVLLYQTRDQGKLQLLFQRQQVTSI